MISVLPFQAATDMPVSGAAGQSGADQSGLSNSGLFSSLLSDGMHGQINALKQLVGGNEELLAQLQSGNLLPLEDLELSLDEIQLPLGQLLSQDMQQLIKDKNLFMSEDMSLEDIIHGLEEVLNPEDLQVLQSIVAQMEDLKQKAPELVARVEDLFNRISKAISKETKAVLGISNVEAVFDETAEGIEEALAKIDLKQGQTALTAAPVSSVLKQIDKSIAAETVGKVTKNLDTNNFLQGFDELLANKMTERSNITGIVNKHAAAPQNYTVEHQVATSEWEQAIGGRLSFMAKNGLTTAKLHLKPAEMGPIEVTVKMQEDQASVSFNAQHATTREALEVAIPRLREMFSQSGLNLADADVQSGAEHAQENNSGDERKSTTNDNSGYLTEAEGEEAEADTEVQVKTLGLVDSYA